MSGVRWAGRSDMLRVEHDARAVRKLDGCPMFAAHSDDLRLAPAVEGIHPHLNLLPFVKLALPRLIELMIVAHFCSPFLLREGPTGRPWLLLPGLSLPLQPRMMETVQEKKSECKKKNHAVKDFLSSSPIWRLSQKLKMLTIAQEQMLRGGWTRMGMSIRKAAISVVDQRLAELNILRSRGHVPADWEMDRRILVYQSLLKQLQQAPEPSSDHGPRPRRLPLVLL